MTKDKMKQEILSLQQELQDYSDLFDLQQTRMKEAVALWQKATGEQYLPDLGTLLEWLMRRTEPDTKQILQIVDKCFHAYASDHRRDAAEYALELINLKPNTTHQARAAEIKKQTVRFMEVVK